MKKPEPKKYLPLKHIKAASVKLKVLIKFINYHQMRIPLDQALMQLQSMRKFQMI